MKFLVDQDVYAATIQILRALGHDAATASERGRSRAADAQLLDMARMEGRILVRRDRDFGGLVFVQSLGAGVLYLRMLPSQLQAVHAERERVLGLYGEPEFRGAFVVIEPGCHRMRRVIATGPSPEIDTDAAADGENS